MRDLLYAGLVFFSVLVTLQSAHTLYLTLYTWDRPHWRSVRAGGLLACGFCV